MEKSKLIKYYFIETTKQGYFTISSTFDYEQVKDRARRQMGNYFRTNEAALGALARANGKHFYSDKMDRHLTAISTHHKRKIVTERLITITTGGKEPKSKYITKVTLL